MKTKETSTREQAIAWWRSIEPDWRIDHCIYYNDKLDLRGRTPSSLTGSEIEQIWLKETGGELATGGEKVLEILNSKLNQKQFKQLDKELHLKHLNKFSLNDKFEITALNLLQLPLTVDELHSITTILKECRDRNKVTK